jgi:electron transfer flavoprotein beta subunit
MPIEKAPHLPKSPLHDTIIGGTIDVPVPITFRHHYPISEIRVSHLKICCCIKQVPGTTEVKINPETNTLVREGVETQINPFDLYALEEAVRTKERLTAAGDPSTVTVITMGPPQAESALREAISLGADDVILLGGRAFAGSDTWCTSYALESSVLT